MPTPFTVVASNITPINATQTFAVTTAVNAGATVVVAWGGNGPALTSITDSKGNTYTQRLTGGTSPVMQLWYCLALTSALTTSDTINAVHSGSGAAGESLIARAMGPPRAVSAVGVAPAPTNQSIATPSIASGVFTGYDQWVIGVLTGTNGAGAPSAPTGGFTIISTQHPGTNQFLTLAELITPGPASVAWGATVAGAFATTIGVASFVIPAIPPVQLPGRRLRPFRAPSSAMAYR